MYRLLLLFLSAILPLFCSADVITQKEAHAIATRFFAGYTHAGVPSLKRVSPSPLSLDASTLGETPTFYIYNRGYRQGFVIVAGDDAVPPILGYSLDGTFQTEGMPDNLQGWMRYVDMGVTEARSNCQSPSPQVRQAWDELSVGYPIVELHTPLWNQDKPYNSLCPSYPGSGNWRPYTGCTITATAIVMGHHQWPPQGEGQLKGYTTNGLGIWVDGVNLDDHSYRWNDMPEINGNILPYDENSAVYKNQEEAVATLMRDLGIMLRARYDYDATSAKLDMLPYRLPRYMRYHEGILYAQHRFFSDEVWHRLLTDELDQLRPIAFAGYGQGGGHSFVLDGYDSQGRFSVNWGWGGISNGFFYLDALSPSNQGAGGMAAGYNADQEAVLRIQPKRPDAIYHTFDDIVFVRNSTAGSNALPGLHVLSQPSDIAAGSTLRVSAGVILNWGSSYYEGPVMLAVTDAQGHIRYPLYTTPGVRCLDPGNAVMPLDEARDIVEVTLSQPVLVGDRLRLHYRASDGRWLPVTTKESDIPWEIVLHPDDTTPASIQVTTTVAPNLGNRALATYSADVATTPTDASVQAYYAEVSAPNTVTLYPLEQTGTQLVIPPHTGVVLVTSGAATFHMQPTTESATVVPASNLLRPSGQQGITVPSAVHAYILAQKDDALNFHPLSDTDRKLSPHRSYLLLPSHMQANSLRLVWDEVTHLSPAPDAGQPQGSWYDLTGRQETAPVRGLYIINGQKCIVP